jgi:glucokinase
MEYRANTQTDVKINNQKMIIDLLVNQGPMTRADLSKRMNTSKPTISKNVEELLQERKILEIGKDDNSLGKKGTLIDINKNYGYILGFDFSKNRLRMALANLRMEWVYEEDWDMELYLPLSQDAYEAKVLDCLEGFIVHSKVNLDKVMYNMISFPAVVGKDNDVHLTKDRMKQTWNRVIKPFMEESLARPYRIKNDIKLATLYEKRFGQFSQEENLYLISADVGVGIGIVIRHELYEGDRFAAGEIGFIQPQEQGERKFYVLEDRISIHVVMERYKAMMGSSCSYRELVTHIEEKKDAATCLYQEIIEELAIVIANLASILDIRHVVLAGRLFELKETMVEELNRLIKKRTSFETEVHRTGLHNMSLHGAILSGIDLVLEEIVG